MKAIRQAETRKIRSDFKRVLVGNDFMLTNIYKMQFKMEDENERQMWAAEPTIMVEMKEQFLNVFKQEK